jgi:hypothetical protein
MILGTGLKIHQWDGPDRVIPAPPLVPGGPFAEMRLAPSPAAAVVAGIGRRRAGSEQPIWQDVLDLLSYAVFYVNATGVRIRDRHNDGRLVGSTMGLRQEGQKARVRLVREDRELVASGGAMAEGDSSGPISDEWTTLAEYLEETVAGIEVPSDSALRTIKADWSLVVPVPRIKALEDKGALDYDYVGTGVVRFRDLLRIKDVNGKAAGGRFACFLAREFAHDIFSVRRQQGLKDWLRFATATLGCASSLGGFGWLLSEVAVLLS